MLCLKVKIFAILENLAESKRGEKKKEKRKKKTVDQQKGKKEIIGKVVGWNNITTELWGVNFMLK